MSGGFVEKRSDEMKHQMKDVEALARLCSFRISFNELGEVILLTGIRREDWDPVSNPSAIAKAREIVIHQNNNRTLQHPNGQKLFSKIFAIQELKKHYDLSLKDAKDLIENAMTHLWGSSHWSNVPEPNKE